LVVSVTGNSSIFITVILTLNPEYFNTKTNDINGAQKDFVFFGILGGFFGEKEKIFIYLLT